MGLKQFFKTKGAIYEYGDYYSSYRDELAQIFQYYQGIGLKVAIWGAGLKGTAFLNLIDKKGKYISYVIDMNKELHGSKVTPKHLISGLEEVMEAMPGVIIIMNAVHYSDNYAMLIEKGYNGIILDLDTIIENSVDPDIVIAGKQFENKNAHNYDLKKIHNQVLDILQEIDRICRKHNLTYFLSAGTALGAIRHKGFIPWDDDADIGMLREDYNRFRKIVQSELGNAYYYQTMGKGSSFYRNFDQVGKNNSAFVLYNMKDLNIHHGIHVDIFPFDYVSEDERRRTEHVKEVQKYRTLLFNKLVPHVINTKNLWKRLIINREYYRMKFIPLRSLQERMEGTLTQHLGKEEQYVADLLTHYKKIMYFRKSDILPVKYIEFEGMKLPVPNNLDAYLTMMYGDYMTPPPEGKRNQRHRFVELSYDKAYEKDRIKFGIKSHVN